MRKVSILLLVCFLFASSCGKKQQGNSGNSNSDSGNIKNLDIVGTWTLYQYQLENSNAVFLKTDTLRFSSHPNYKYNSLDGKYYLSDMSTGYRLTLENTSFGDITAILPYNFQSTGEINGIKFSVLYNTQPQNYFLWLKKL